MTARTPESNTEFLARFGVSLRDHGIDADARTVLSALIDAVTDRPCRAGLTGAEQEFAIAGGVPAEVLTPEGDRAAAIWQAASTIWEAERQAHWLTGPQIAEMLDLTAEEVHQLQVAGDLYGAPRLDGQLAYPRWQVTANHRLLPAVREIVTALPADHSAVDIETALTSPAEELEGDTPLQWLEAGRPLEPLLRVLSELDL
ncbi:hypothetical protein [Glutamicibacter protophormiae]|uniref:hypothetical protein n=1 Tax=Glutamicibacter protophormiae TaxID=37930 RepID=UPI003A9565E1